MVVPPPDQHCIFPNTRSYPLSRTCPIIPTPCLWYSLRMAHGEDSRSAQALRIKRMREVQASLSKAAICRALSNTPVSTRFNRPRPVLPATPAAALLLLTSLPAASSPFPHHREASSAAVQDQSENLRQSVGRKQVIYTYSKQPQPSTAVPEHASLPRPSELATEPQELDELDVEILGLGDDNQSSASSSLPSPSKSKSPQALPTKVLQDLASNKEGTGDQVLQAGEPSRKKRRTDHVKTKIIGNELRSQRPRKFPVNELVLGLSRVEGPEVESRCKQRPLQVLSQQFLLI